MANNRIYLYCPQCKAEACLAKCYDDGYFADAEKIGETLMEFTEAHFWCGGMTNAAGTGDAMSVELRFAAHHDKGRELPRAEATK